MSLDEAIARIPNKKGWLRIWLIFAFVWIAGSTATHFLPANQDPNEGSIGIDLAPLVMPPPDVSAQANWQRHWDTIIGVGKSAGLIVGVPLAIPIAAVVASFLICWVREGFDDAN